MSREPYRVDRELRLPIVDLGGLDAAADNEDGEALGRLGQGLPAANSASATSSIMASTSG